MLLEDVKRWLNATPFEPFLMHTAGGKALPVHHPELVHFPADTPLLEVYLPEDKMALVEPCHITHLETIAASNASA